LVEEYVKEGKAALPPPSKKSRFGGKYLQCHIFWLVRRAN